MMSDKEPLTGAAPAAPGAGQGTGVADRLFSAPVDAPKRDIASIERGGRDSSSSRRDVARAEGGSAIDSPANLRISRTTAPAAVNPDVATGYASLQGGDLDGATQAYERALRADPSNRDALLGIATIQLRLNRTDAAEASFRRVMRLYPQDTYAAAQLAALQAGSDPVGALSQVNSLIAREADRADAGNGALPFIQGNQLAAQGRWNEAQQAYFNAHRADPNNPDFCYNLAVSLDRIHESRLARDYYAKALELARSRAAGFDTTRAQTRLVQLGPASR
jgi:Tfp pilus assembly protein PilF